MSSPVRECPNAHVFFTVPRGNRISTELFPSDVCLGSTNTWDVVFVADCENKVRDSKGTLGDTLGALRGGGGDVETFLLRASRSCSIFLRSMPKKLRLDVDTDGSLSTFSPTEVPASWWNLVCEMFLSFLTASS